MEEIFSFGLWLRRRRKALDRTQAELAQRVGCATITIRRIEADDLRPSLEIAERLAVCLEIPETERTAFLAAARSERAVDTLPQPLDLPLDTSSGAAHHELRLTNMPFPLTNFVGRIDERAELAELIRANRLVTITGMGGSGKTRLALQVSSDVLERFADGVWFVDLAPIRDGYFLAQTIANVLEVRETAAQNPLGMLCANLRSKQMLLILDNCEHLLAACAEIADALLRHCPQLHLLVTSREALSLLGEQLYPIPPLRLPLARSAASLDDLMRVESVRLFYERARAAQPRFAMTDENAGEVAEICRRLDGLPLAIELAAAHIRRFSAQTLLERLDKPLAVLVGGPRNLPKRQQTLRTTIDWSYQLLEEDERRLFARLGVFVGGWTPSAAKVVCNSAADLRQPVEAGLDSLLDKSLIRLVEDDSRSLRYAMLGTLQSYALEQLTILEEAEVMHWQHAEYYLDLVEGAEAALAGGQATAWLNRFDREHENLRAVLSWAFAASNAARITIGLRLCAVLWRFWWIRGYVYEGRRWLDLALTHQNQAVPPVRAALFYGSGVLARMQGDLALATAYQHQSLELWKALNDRAGIALAVNSLGVIAFNQGDYDRARAFFEESLALYRELGDTNRVAVTINNLGNVAYKQADLERATEFYQEGLRLLQGDLANKQTIALIKTNLGDIARLRKEYRRAATLLHEGVMTHLELNDTENILFCLNNLVEIAIDQGQHELAAQVLGAADALYEQSGAARSPDQQQDYQRQMTAIQSQVSADQIAASWSQGRSTAPSELFTYAITTILTATS